MRKKSHLEGTEPFFDKILSSLRFKKVEKYIEPDSKILDLGCGYNGRLLAKLETKIKSGVGIDISVNANYQNQKIQLIAYDLNANLPLQGGEFDFVVSLANLEHLENPKKMLEEIYRVLKPGGKLLLTTPSTYGKPVLEFLAAVGLVSKQEIRDHKNYFSKKILLDHCREIGFSSCRHKYFQLGMNNYLIAKK